MNGRPLKTCPKCGRRVCARNRNGSGGLYRHLCVSSVTVVTEWEWDDEGYPTEGTLKAIAEWRGDDFAQFFAKLRLIWKYSDPGGWCGWHESDCADEVTDFEVHRYRLSTGGWSGNESLIAAMRENYVLWALTWTQERKGGHFIFDIRRKP